jgi:hypothetical protein
MSFNDNVRANVELLETRAREAALQEVDRATGIDQKATALIAAGLVLVAAGVAFATGIGSAHAGTGARLLWALLLVAAFILLLAALGLATAAVRPRVFRIVLHMNVLNKWASTRYLDRDPTRVRGELMQGSVSAVREARKVNKKKADRLLAAFMFFAAAILAIVVLGAAVALRMAASG